MYFETQWGIPRTHEPGEDPITEKSTEIGPTKLRTLRKTLKRLDELKADLAKQFPKKKYWDKKQILRQYESMTLTCFFSNDDASSRIWSNLFRKTTFSENLLLHSKHFFRAVFRTAAFSTKLIPQKTNLLRTSALSEKVLFANR